MAEEKKVAEEAKEEKIEASEEKTKKTSKEESATKPAEDAKEETKKEDEKEEDKKEESMPELKPGMTVRIHQRIKETNAKGEEKERIQFFEGMIIAKKHGKEAGGTITVRKISNGVGVEKIFPLNLPTIDKIEIKKIAEVKRAKLYFLKRGYKKKLKEKVIKA